MFIVQDQNWVLSFNIVFFKMIRVIFFLSYLFDECINVHFVRIDSFGALTISYFTRVKVSEYSKNKKKKELNQPLILNKVYIIQYINI